MTVPTFDRFPLDGKLYCLVCAGKVAAPHLREKTARVRVWLVRVDESHSNRLTWARRPSGAFETVMLEESAGSIPAMVLGSFWRDRTMESGHFLSQEMRVENALVRPQRVRIVRASDSPATLGPLRMAEQTYPFEGEDARGSRLRFGDAPLVRCVTDSGLELLVPSYEIFRRFYGMSTELANAMLSGHWMPELQELVDLNRTGLTANAGAFEVFPKVALRDITCMAIASFMTAPGAQERVGEIFLNLHNARRSGTLEPWIHAAPPWSRAPMYISFVGHQLPSGAVLVTWIYHSPFPELAHPVVRVQEMMRVPIERDDAPAQAPGPSLQDRMDELANNPIQPAADACPSYGIVHFNLAESWGGLPRLQRRSLQTEFVPVNSGTSQPPAAPKKLRLTTGHKAQHGSLSSASLSSDQQNTITNRFAALAECFTLLTKSGHIQARRDYALSNPVQAEGRSYCAFAQTIGNIDRPWATVLQGPLRARLCWVSEVVWRDDRKYYWFEVETQPGEAIKALLVKPVVADTDLPVETLQTILKCAVISNGVWRTAALHTAQEQVTWRAVRHSFVSGRMNGGTVIAAFTALQ